MLPTMHNGLLDFQHQDGCGAHQLQSGESKKEGLDCLRHVLAPCLCLCRCRYVCLSLLCLLIQHSQ